MKKNHVLIISICVLAASIPLFMNYLIEGDDLIFHLNRIEAMYDGIKNGSFPVKIHPLWLNDHGYPVGVFYGDWLLYIPVLFRFLGFSLVNSYQLFLFSINMITGLVAYYCFGRLFKNNNMGVTGAVIYTLSLYRLENLYSRAAVGEFCAMIFLPMILLGMYEILIEKTGKHRIKPEIILILGLVGLVHCHILSCVIVAIFILIACVICLKKVFQPYIFRTLCFAVLLTIVLSLDFLVPFLDYYMMDYFKFTAENWISNPIQEVGLFLNQIFAVFVKPRGGSWNTDVGVANETTFSLGLTGIVGVVLFIYWFINIPTEKKKTSDYKLAIYAGVMFALAIFMSTCYFPWNYISNMNDVFYSLVTVIQFPWRFLSIGSLFCTVFICIILNDFRNQLSESLKYLPIYTVLFSIVITVGWYNNSIIFDSEYGKETPYSETDDTYFKYVYTGEYLPQGTDINLLEYNKIVSSPNVEYEKYVKNGLRVNCYVSADDTEGYIEFPMLYYKGYTAVDVETGMLLNITNGENNVVHVIIPADFSGDIEVCFKEPAYWRIAEVLTLCGLIIIFLNIIRRTICELHKM